MKITQEDAREGLVQAVTCPAGDRTAGTASWWCHPPRRAAPGEVGPPGVPRIPHLRSLCLLVLCQGVTNHPGSHTLRNPLVLGEQGQVILLALLLSSDGAGDEALPPPKGYVA